MALINDDRLPGGQEVVLCHPDAEQETDNLGAVMRTRYVQRRGRALIMAHCWKQASKRTSVGRQSGL